VTHGPGAQRPVEEVQEDLLRRVAEIVEAEEGPRSTRRLTTDDPRRVRFLIVEELLSPDEAALPGRLPRRHRIVRGDADLIDVLADADLEAIVSRQESYRDGHAMQSVSADMAEELHGVLADWQAAVASPEPIRVRLRHAEEIVVPCRARRSALRLWVGLRSGKVLARRKHTIGLGRVAAGAAVFVSLPGAPLVGAAAAGATGAAVGGLLSAVILLGAVVSYGGAKSLVGWGERSERGRE
jgi:hypothetical protein